MVLSCGRGRGAAAVAGTVLHPRDQGRQVGGARRAEHAAVPPFWAFCRPTAMTLLLCRALCRAGLATVSGLLSSVVQRRAWPASENLVEMCFWTALIPPTLSANKYHD
jgi:hypothetical protein